MARAGYRYISLGDAIAIHEIAMVRTGYQPAPLRDENALGSALMRPQMAAHYEQADLIRQTTLLAIGISQAQAFVDGNKRTALFVTGFFLTINSYRFTGDVLEFAKQLEKVADRETDLDTATSNFEDWLRPQIEER